MNLIIGAPVWLVALLSLALLAAAIEDAARFRISNLTCATVAALAFVAIAEHGFAVSLWQNAVVFLLILGLGTAAFGAGWLGGGDVKLFAALGLWFDLRSAVGLVIAIFLAGGIVAIAYIVGRRIVQRDNRPKIRSGRIPYGLAIVAGAAFTFAVQYQTRPVNPGIERLREIQAHQRAG